MVYSAKDMPKKETVAKTEPQQPNNAVSSGSSLSKDEQSGTSSIEPNGEPTVSDSKVTDSASDKQEGGAESSVQPAGNKEVQPNQRAVEAASAQVNTSPAEAQGQDVSDGGRGEHVPDKKASIGDGEAGSRAENGIVRHLAERLGLEVEEYDDADDNVNGSYANGKISINRRRASRSI